MILLFYRRLRMRDLWYHDTIDAAGMSEETYHNIFDNLKSTAYVPSRQDLKALIPSEVFEFDEFDENFVHEYAETPRAPETVSEDSEGSEGNQELARPMSRESQSSGV